MLHCSETWFQWLGEMRNPTKCFKNRTELWTAFILNSNRPVNLSDEHCTFTETKRTLLLWNNISTICHTARHMQHMVANVSKNSFHRIYSSLLVYWIAYLVVLYVAQSMCLQQPSFLTRRLQSENCVPKALQTFKPKEMYENGVIIITGE
jgi:hypothetical protein